MDDLQKNTDICELNLYFNMCPFSMQEPLPQSLVLGFMKGTEMRKPHFVFREFIVK